MTAAVGVDEAGPAPSPPDVVVATTYRLSIRIRYDYASPVRDLRQRLMVVPPVNHGAQRRMSWSIRTKGGSGVRSRTGRDRFGNVVIVSEATKVTRSIEFAVDTDVSRRPGRQVRHRVRSESVYLPATRLTEANDAITRLARTAGGDAAALCRLVHARFSYEHDATSVATTAAEAITLGRGVCQDYAHVMLAACRAGGIPARYVSGHLVGEGGSHAWVEVLVPDGDGWWRVEAWDPTHDRAVAAGYVTVAVGRDYADVAPMSGTYSGAADAGRLSVHKLVSVA